LRDDCAAMKSADASRYDLFSILYHYTHRHGGWPFFYNDKRKDFLRIAAPLPEDNVVLKITIIHAD